MDIVQSSEFLSITKDRHILLDTTVFIDASNNPVNLANIFSLIFLIWKHLLQ